MARSLDELYQEIARLPAADRLRLAARILNELAEETSLPTPERPVEQWEGEAPAEPVGHRSAAQAARQEPRPPTAQPAEGKVPAPVSVPRAIKNGKQPVGKERGSEGARATERTPDTGARFLVVDGSNLLGRLPGFELNSPASREKLTLRLQEYAHAHPRTRVTLYFDGQQASATQRGGIEVRYSPGTRPADFFILEYLGRLQPAECANTRLVTADRELADQARLLGVTIEAPEQFQRQIAGPPRAPVDRGLSKAEVAEWEEYFRRRPEER